MKLWFRKRRDAELDAEIRAHLTMAIRDHMTRGESPEEARHNARRELGNELLIKEVTRDTWGWIALERVGQDLRYALRQMRRSPGFTVIAVLTLALGLGATTTIFTVVESVLLRPLAFRDPDRLVNLYELFPPRMARGSFSVPNLRDVQAQTRSFSGIQAYSFVNRNLQDAAEAERIVGAEVESRMFELLGENALLGRTFRADEDHPDAQAVVILGEALWRRRFGADSLILGKSITLDRQSYAVVGVMPESFRFPPGTSLAEFWTPLRPDTRQTSERGNHYLSVLARLAPGIELRTARKELEGIAAQLAKLYSGQEGRNIAAIPVQEVVSGNVRPALFILMGAVGLVLLIACVNVSNLLLARSLARRKEVVIRAALGASRNRIAWQFLVESLILALGGGALGLLVALWSIHAVASLPGLRLPRLAELQIDAWVFGFLVAASMLTSVIFGIAPALLAARADPGEELQRAPSRGLVGGRHPLKAVLVAVEVALSLILLVGAGLLIKSFMLLRSVDSGLKTENVLTLQVSLPAGNYPPFTAPQRFIEPLRARVLSLPGVRSAGWISALPLQTFGSSGDFYIEGHPELQPKDAPLAEYRQVSPGYFQALGIPVLRGRAIDATDTRDTPVVALVNQALVDKYFDKREDPIGRVILRGRRFTIVGIVGNTRQLGLSQPPEPEIYIPMTQYESSFRQISLVVSTQQPPQNLVSAVRAAIAEVDRGVPASNVKTMERVVAESLSDRSFYAALLGIFAGIALLLSLVGIYGVLSFLISQRTQEIGLRMALGATNFNVLSLVVGNSLKPVVAGIVMGVGGALVATRLLKTLLYGVSTNDATTFVTVCLTMVAVALGASWLPARRAASVDPAIALRQD